MNCGVALNMHADETDEFENLALWVVKGKPEITEIASKLENLTYKYQEGKVSKFTRKLKNLLEPFNA